MIRSLGRKLLVVATVAIVASFLVGQVALAGDAPSPRGSGVTNGITTPASIPVTQAASLEATLSPASITEIGHIGGGLSTVTVDGPIAYVGVGHRMLAIDISDATRPVLIGTSPVLPDVVRAIAVANRNAYVADAAGGLRVFDVSDPGHLTEFGSLPGEVDHVVVAGSLAYVQSSSPTTEGSTDVRIVNVANPAKLVPLSSIDLPGSLVAFIVQGAIGYVGMQRISATRIPSGSGLFVLDLAGPTRPKQIDVFPDSVSSLTRLGNDLYETGYDSSGRSLARVLDISNPGNPRIMATTSSFLGCEAEVCEIGSVQAAQGHFLYLVISSGLHVLDASDPLHPVDVGAYQLPGQFREVGTIAVNGPWIYATDGAGNGLHVIDVTQPSQPKEVGAYLAPGHISDLALAGRYAYVADGFNSTLHVLDLSDPRRPVEVSSLQFFGSIRSIALRGSDAFVIVVGRGLQVVDVSDPIRLNVVGSISLGVDRAGAPVDARRVAVEGNHAYVPDTINGLHVFDVSDPGHPVQVGLYSGKIDPYSLAVSGSFVYVDTYDAGGQRLLILDVVNPTQPSLVGSLPLRASPRAFVAVGRYVYVTYWTGLDVIDVSNPRQPVVVGSLDGLYGVKSIAVSSTSIWLTDDDPGVRLVDATDLGHLSIVATYPVGQQEAVPVAVRDGLAYVGTLFDGLFILQPTAPHDARYFSQTGFRIANGTIWDYFNRRGGITTFGYPISRAFRLQGFTVQMFQRQVVQLDDKDQARLLNLLDPGLLPYVSFNGALLPAVDGALLATTPEPTDATATLAWIKTHAPDSSQGMPVNFYQTYIDTVSTSMAFPNWGDPSLLPGFDLEMWGLPTSTPQLDPNNHNVVYLRFQRGVMQYDGSCSCTRGMLLADYLKSILTGENLPPDLDQQARGSSFYRQYDPTAPNWLRDASRLPRTDLTDAFTSESFGFDWSTISD